MVHGVDADIVYDELRSRKNGELMYDAGIETSITVLADYFAHLESEFSEFGNGQWEVRIVPDDNPFFQKRFYCSVCGDWQTYGRTRYCPMCGARMDDQNMEGKNERE